MSADEVARLLYEAVAEDERLRDDLDDAAFAPLLAWAARRADALAPGSGARIDAVAAALREAVRALVTAIRRGDVAPLAAVRSEIIPPHLALQIAEAVRRAPGTPEARAEAVATQLAEADP